MKKFTIFITVSSVIALSGCAITTAGIKKGDERNFARSMNDVSAGRVIKARMMRAPDIKLGGVNVGVAEGIVVLSGNVDSDEDRIEAERIAWSAPNVERIGNEIKVKGKKGAIRGTKDAVLSQSVRARMVADKYVKSRNYNIEVHDGTVYLLGIARSKQELERAAQIASTTRGTREVVSYVKISERGTRSVAAPAHTPSYSAPVNGVLTGSQSGAIPFVPQGTIEAPSSRVSQRALPSILQNAPLGGNLPSGANAAVDGIETYATGRAGQAVDVTESAPYYINPDTGEEIPVKWVQGGQ